MYWNAAWMLSEMKRARRALSRESERVRARVSVCLGGKIEVNGEHVCVELCR